MKRPDFPMEYFEDEVREGFYVDGMMKASWATQIDILCEIDEICKNHDIKYFLDFGSLLGAVRHKGCIPWDDDFDIIMTRENLNKFRKYMSSELPKGFKVMSIRDDDVDGYYSYITRVINSDEMNVSEKFLTEFHRFPYVAGVDIFCFDNVPENEGEAGLIKDIAIIGKKIHDYVIEDEANDMDEELFNNAVEAFEKLTNQKLDREGNLSQQVFQISDSLFQIYSEEDSDFYAIMVDWINSKEGSYKFPKEWFRDSVQVEVEGVSFPAPIEYDQVLTKRYSAKYMTPIRAGGSHEYPFYKKQYEELKKEYGPSLYLYEFNPDDLKNDERINYRNVEQQTDTFISLLENAHKEIHNFAMQRNLQAALTMLVDCQGGAIAIGNMIDQQEGDGHPTVKLLEGYCEAVYRVHETMAGATEQTIDEIADNALSCLEDMRLSIASSMAVDLKKKKQIVFIPYKAQYWDSLKDKWQEAVDSGADVYVMPVPYFYKKANATADDMVYDIESYPEEVHAIPFNEYDLEKRHPDEIYIQNPYDDKNFATIVHPLFHSSNLKKLTEKLIYIPWFKTDEIPANDGRAYESMIHFALMPGVVNADEVIVQSEAMRETYIRKLVDFSGEEYRRIWENKIKSR